MVYRLHFFGFSFRGSLLVSNILGRKNTTAGDRPPLSNRAVASESLPKLLHSTAQFFIGHSEKAACLLHTVAVHQMESQPRRIPGLAAEKIPKRNAVGEIAPAVGQAGQKRFVGTGRRGHMQGKNPVHPILTDPLFHGKGGADLLIGIRPEIRRGNGVKSAVRAEKGSPRHGAVILVPVAHAMICAELVYSLLHPKALPAGKAPETPHSSGAVFRRLPLCGTGTGAGAARPSYCPTQQSRSSRQHRT